MSKNLLGLPISIIIGISLMLFSTKYSYASEQTEAIIINVLGKESRHYSGCGFPELEFGMSLDDVKKALPGKRLAIEKFYTGGEFECYSDERGSEFTFKAGKLIATAKMFPLSGDSSEIISQVIDSLGNFTKDDYFKIALSHKSSADRSFSSWQIIEAVLYNFEKTHAALIIATSDGSIMRRQKSLHLVFVDSIEIKDYLEKFIDHIQPIVQWTGDLISGIGDDGALGDFQSIPKNMVVDSDRFTPGVRYMPHYIKNEDGTTTRVGDEPEYTLDRWKFRNEKDRDANEFWVTATIERARTDQYKDLPKGYARGEIFVDKIDIPGIPLSLRSSFHMNLLYLRILDRLYRMALENAKISYYEQDVLSDEKLDNRTQNAKPYRIYELSNGYVFEVVPSGNIRFHPLTRAEKIL